MDIKLIKKLNELGDLNQFEEAERILDELLKNDPHNTELWLRYALFELRPPISYQPKSIECLNSILTYDPCNADAILLLAYIYDYMAGGIDEELITKLSSIKTEDPEYLSMIEYIKSRRYFGNDNAMHELHLLKSIQKFQGHVYNYRDLGWLYTKTGRQNEGKKLLHTALKNVKLVYPYPSDNTFFHDYTDVHEYFNELVKGIHMTFVNYQSLEEELMEGDASST